MVNRNVALGQVAEQSWSEWVGEGDFGGTAEILGKDFGHGETEAGRGMA
jgi:hypothetical protein